MKTRQFLFLFAGLFFARAGFCQPTKRPLAMTIKSLSPNLGVKNVAQTVQFYHDLLGFVLITSVPGQDAGKPLDWAMVQSGSVTLMFQQEDNLKEEYKNLATQAVGGAFTLYLTITDFGQTFEKAKQMSTILVAPHKTFYGAMEFAMKDINGYTLTLAEGAP